MIVNKKFTIDPFATLLQEQILHILSKGPIEGMDILKQITKESRPTKQGLYKILRKLLFNEVILKESNYFSLNKVWLSHLNNFVIESEKNSGTILPFSDADSINKKTIKFKNAETLNIYWGHLFLTLQKNYNNPFFFFNWHSWFIYENHNLESYLYKTSLNNTQKIMITLGSSTEMAKEFKKRFMKNNIQIAIDEKFNVPTTDHLCIIGDYFIVTRYGSKTMAQINSLFHNTTSFNDKKTMELHKILSNCKKPKIIITKDIKKATIWKRRLAKNFAINVSDF